MIKPYNFTFDIKGRNNVPRLELTRGDTNTYQFNITLIDDALPVVLTDQTVRLVLAKNDNTSVFKDFDIVSALTGNIKILLSSQAVACLGNVDAEIKIYGPNNELLTSNKFYFDVVRGLLDESTIVSSNEFSVLTEALNAVNDAVISIPTVEALNIDLQENITTGDALKTVLEADIVTGDALKTVLESDIVTATTKKTDLAAVIATANLTTYASKGSVDAVTASLATMTTEFKVVTTNAQTDGVNNTFGHLSNKIADDVSTSCIAGGGSTGYNNVIGGDGTSTVDTVTPNVAIAGTVAHVSFVAGYDNVAGSLSSKIISDHSYTEIGGSGHNCIYGGAGNKIRATANFAGIFAGYQCDVSGAGAVAIGASHVVSGARGFASGDHHTVSGVGAKATGSTNIVSGTYAESHGQLNTASGNFSIASGNYAYSRTVGQRAFSTGKIAVLGDAQTSDLEMHRVTTDATVATIGVVGSSASHTLLPNQSVVFSVMVIARDTTGTDSSAWEIKGMARRGATGSTVIVNPVITVLGQDAGASLWALVVTGDSNGGLNIRATGVVGKTIKWVQRMTIAEVMI